MKENKSNGTPDGMLDKILRSCISMFTRRPADSSQSNSLMREAYQAYGQKDTDQAMSLCRAALQHDDTNAEAHCLTGALLAQAGKLEAAEKELLRAIELDRHQPDAHRYLGNVFILQSRPAEARMHYTAALELDPEDVLTYSSLANAEASMGNAATAIEHLMKAVSLSPQDFKTRYRLASLLFKSKRYSEALTEYEQCLAIEPESVAALSAIGITHLRMKDGESALEFLKQAVDKDPEDPTAVAGLARASMLQGRYDDAHTLIKPFLDNNNVNPTMLEVLCDIAPHLGLNEQTTRVMKSWFETRQERSDTATGLRFCYASLLDRNRQYDEAFENYALANTLKQRRFDRQSHADYIDRIITVFDCSFLETAPRSTTNTGSLVFVVGMPRSGTTLIESIIASHPQGRGAGEVTFIPKTLGLPPDFLGTHQPYPECARELQTDALDEFARQYKAHVGVTDADRDIRVADKLPDNFLRLGFISMAFPGAKIVHCIRHPIDTCLSCYFQNFISLPYTSDLDNLVFYYQQYKRLMAHWESTLQMPILHLRYEDLVAQPDVHARKLIEFCDLPWDERCLSFPGQDRFVYTASSGQVRRSIYTDSVGRWEHYREHIGPLIRGLGD